jgi:PPM family protein phosphatase
MGGHESGEVASRMAVDLFADRVTDAYPKLTARRRKLSLLRSMTQELIIECTIDANQAIFEEGRRRAPDGDFKSRMGTTLALVLVLPEFAVVANVGDSRVYRIRDWVIEQVSEDHVIMAEKKRHPADPRPPRMRKYVTRALGTKAEVEPDVYLVDVFPDDLFLLCSDGLTDVVTDDEIRKIIRKQSPDYRLAVRSLISLANKRGGPDNVTVGLVEALISSALTVRALMILRAEPRRDLATART